MEWNPDRHTIWNGIQTDTRYGMESRETHDMEWNPDRHTLWNGIQTDTRYGMETGQTHYIEGNLGVMESSESPL